MEDVITIATNLSTKGFERGSKALKRAVISLGQSVTKMGRGMISTFRRITPMILGVGSAYQVLSKAINAYMQENEKLGQRMSAIWTALGNVIGPIVEQVIDWISSAVSYFLEFLRLLGVTNKTASELSKKAKKNSEDLRRTIAGFDELNVLNKPNENENKENPLEDKQAPDWMKRLIDMIKNKEWDAIADMIINGMNKLIYAFRDKAYELGDKIGEYLGAALHIIARVIDEVDWHALGEALALFLNGIMNHIDGEDLGKILVGKFTIAIKILTGFLETLDGGRLGTILSDTIISALDSLSRALAQADWEKIGKNIANFFGSIDYVAIAESILKLLKTAWKSAMGLLHSFLSDPKTAEGLYNLGAAIRTFFSNIDWEQVKEDLKLLLQELWDAAMQFLRGIMGVEEGEDPPLLKNLEKIKTTIEEKVVPAINTFMDKAWPKLEKVLNLAIEKGLPKLLEDIADLLEDLSRAIGDGDWKGFVENFNGLETALLALGGLKLIGGLTNLIGKIKDIIGLFGGGSAAGGAGGSAAGSGIFAGLKSFFAGLPGVVSGGVAALDSFYMGATGATLAAGALTATGAGLVAALGIVPAILLDNKLASDYVTKAFEDTDGSAEGLAIKMNELAETASHYEECLYDTTGYTAELGYSAQESAYAAAAYDEMLKQLAQTLGMTSEELQDLINFYHGDVTKVVELAKSTGQLSDEQKALVDTTKDVNSSVSEMGDEVKKAGEEVDTAMGQVKSSVEENASAASKEADNEFKTMADRLKEHMDSVKKAAKEGINSAKETISVNVKSMVESVSSGAKGMAEKFASGMSSLVEKAKSRMSTLSSNIRATLTNLGNNAQSWGAHLVSNFANGISSRMSSLLSQVRSMAQSIRSYLHFTEPDVGPLSDFNTYAPDMMKTFAEGISQNKKYIISALESVTDEMSKGMQEVKSGFEFKDKVGQLSSLASEFSGYNTSGVVGGTVVPYSTYSSEGQDRQSAFNEDFIAGLKSALTDVVTEMGENLENRLMANSSVSVIIDGKVFYRATYRDLQSVINEHGISLISSGRG